MRFHNSLILDKPSQISLTLTLKKFARRFQKKTDPKLAKGSHVMVVRNIDSKMKQLIGKAAWSNNVKEILEKHGSFVGLVGFVTQYEDNDSVEFMKKLYGKGVPERPWVRVTFHINNKLLEPCHFMSVSMNANSIMTVGEDVYSRLVVAANKRQENLRRDLTIIECVRE